MPQLDIRSNFKFEVKQVHNFIRDFTRWTATQPDIQAVALVGSYAREAATATSDIDLVVLADEPDRFLQDTAWVEQFGTVISRKSKDYGKVISLRVEYAALPEVEFGLTTPDWAAAPLDEGTQKVISNGMQVLFERETLLSPILTNLPPI
jgi:predicted nucleotidyltransferase